jgi:pimeloyl-ACP methyl ester carboxylesterase
MPLHKGEIAHEFAGVPLKDAGVLIVWGHGWGQSRQSFKPFTESLTQQAHLLVDFPGFGASPMPSLDWGTAEYADAMAEMIAPLRAGKKIIWAGHSFGGRVGVQLAARRPDLVDGLFLVASSGLPRQRSLLQALKFKGRIYTYKALKKLAPLLGIDTDKLRGRFGSADYKSAGEMRAIFLNTIRENLTDQARQVKCPAYLVYGENDTETPPEIGQRLAKLIPRAEISVLPGQDHYSVLGAGRHLVLKRLSDFMRKL